jgi:hypothetical protein
MRAAGGKSRWENPRRGDYCKNCAKPRLRFDGCSRGVVQSGSHDVSVFACEPPGVAAEASIDKAIAFPADPRKKLQAPECIELIHNGYAAVFIH